MNINECARLTVWLMICSLTFLTDSDLKTGVRKRMDECGRE